VPSAASLEEMAQRKAPEAYPFPNPVSMRILCFFEELIQRSITANPSGDQNTLRKAEALAKKMGTTVMISELVTPLFIDIN